MSTKKPFSKYTIFDFKENIKSVEDFPTLEEFIKWADKHRVNMVSAFNHLVYVMKPKKQFILNQKV